MHNFIKEYNLAKKIAIRSKQKIFKKKITNYLVQNRRDIKTNYDYEVNQYITSQLDTTSYHVLSEENNNNKFFKNKLQWIIDPIDGTFNLSKGFNFSCISISLWKGNKPLLGILQDIFSKNVYHSLINRGSRLNNLKIEVSNEKNIYNASLLTGFPVNRNYSKKSLQRSINNFKKFKKIRMLGSAALSLALVARGIFDFYYEEDIYIWDVAAGLSLINEAEGKFKLIKTKNNFKYNVMASNKYLLKEFLKYE